MSKPTQKKAWGVPKIFDIRLGFEITMYVFSRLINKGNRGD